MTEGGQGQPKTKSFFDLVYNYFAESAEADDAREKVRKEEVNELRIVAEVKKKLLTEDPQVES